MDFWDRMFSDGFSEGRWNSKAIPIMNELVQMGPVPVLASNPPQNQLVFPFVR